MNKYLESFNQYLNKFLVAIKRYQVVVFIVFLALVFGFLIYRINSLSSQQPSDSDVTAQAITSKSPHIDQSVVDKIQTLQDNSVQVKGLFNNARSNPFAE
jgi:hypothetical protein